MAITSTGFGSGLPINDLVSQLVAADGAPATNRLDRREANLQTELSAIGLLKGALSDFQTSLKKLTNLDNFTSRTAKSSDNAVASIKVEQQANQGSYTLDVQQLASAHKLVGQSGYTAGDTGTLTFTNAAGDSFDVEIDDDSASLEGVRDAINNAGNNFGVTATILNLDSGPRLVLTSDETGADNRITAISSASTSGDLSVFDYAYSANADAALDGDDSNFDQVTAAADARFTLEGQALTSSSNTVEGVIPDVTLTLKKVTEDDAQVALTVSSDTAAVQKNIEGFVKAYNDLQSLISKQTSYDSTTGNTGTLLGDAMTRTIQNQLRSAFSSRYNEGSDINSLVSLGISTTREGTLEVDSTKLENVLKSNFNDVSGFFAADDSSFARKLNATLDVYLKRDGAFASRTDSINEQMVRIDGDREALNTRLEKLEARLFSQFNAMDAVVAQLNNTGDYLSQQLASIAEIGNYRKD